MPPVIEVNSLSKSFIISHEGSRESYIALRDVIVNKTKNLFSKPSQTVSKEEFWALKDVSFKIEQGERVGIIGHNGAGKSTLLKILSRITEPTKGNIKIRGRVASLLEVGTGFHPELTGRENIFLNGAILGMSRAEIRKKFDEIVAFAEIEKFLDTPVKRYSSGMYVRLAFAVAAHLEPEILVVDEVLAVGDAQFQKKCLGKMEKISNDEGRTVLFVSHQMTAVKALCNKGIYLKNGSVLRLGNIDSIVESYMQNGMESENSRQWNWEEAPGNDAIKIVAARVYALSDSNKIITTTDDIVFEIDFFNLLADKNVDITLDIYDVNGIHLCHFGMICSPTGQLSRGTHRTKGIFPKNILNSTRYIINLLFGLNQRTELLRVPNVLVFDVEDEIETRGNNFNKMPGIIHPIIQWTTEILD